MFHSIKGKLMLLVTLQLLLVFFLGIQWKFQSDKGEEFFKLRSNLDQLGLETLEMRQAELNYLRLDLINPEYFESGESEFINEFNVHYKSAEVLIRQLEKNELLHGNEVTMAIDSSKQILLRYEALFGQLTTACSKRGFKDYGAVGEMRQAIHNIYYKDPKYVKADGLNEQILVLRKHEKDFIIRRDPKYFGKFNRVADQLLGDLSALNVAYRSSEYKKELQGIIDNIETYKVAFAGVVRADQQIGLTHTEGLLGQVGLQVAALEPNVQVLKELISNELEASKQKSFWLVLSIALAVFLCFLSLAYWLVKSINSSIKSTKAAIDHIAKGDLTVAVRTGTRGELGEIEKNLDRMIGRFREVLEQVSTLYRSLSRTSLDLRTESQSLSDNANSQAASIEEFSSTMEQMTAQIQETANNAQETSTLASAVSESLDKSVKNVKSANEEISEIAQRVEVIGEISRQTNMLALNAAVEAARAGDQGRGFAVVAGEVRKLADRSGASASNIEVLAERIKGNAFESTNKLEGVLPEIYKTNALMLDIARATDEQNRATVQIADTLVGLNDNTQHIARTSDNVLAHSEKTLSQAKALKEAIEYFTIIKNEAEDEDLFGKKLTPPAGNIYSPTSQEPGFELIVS